MHERFVVFKQAAMLMKQENFFRRILKKSLVPSGRKQLFSCQSTWPPWRELKVQGFIWRDLTPNFNYLYLTDTLLNKYPDLLFVLKHKHIPFQPQNGDRIEAFASGKWVPRPASFLVASAISEVTSPVKRYETLLPTSLLLAWIKPLRYLKITRLKSRRIEGKTNP